MGEIGSNLTAILSAWLALQRSGSRKEFAGILDEGVTWLGHAPGQVCHNRQEVLRVLARNGQLLRLTRVEAQETGDRVAISVEGPDFPDTDDHAAGEPRSLVFTFRAGKVVQMNSVTNRDAAFDFAAG